MNTKIIFLTPYPSYQAPSQRFRFEQYYTLLDQNKIKYATKPFLTQSAWKVFYSSAQIRSGGYLILGYIRRIIHLMQIPFFDYVFIHREVSPLGPPIFEWIISKVLRKKIIYDFDDAIWLSDPNEKHTLLAKLKWKGKVASICKWSYKISVGNDYLAYFAKKHNKNVVINPTTVDTKGQHNPFLNEERSQENRKKASANSSTIIGWTGTHSTLQYLTPIISVISELEEKYNFIFLVIANKNPKYELKSFQYVPWNKETEITDLSMIDIGIMPLTNDVWSKGKCGFKLLQYMALEKPVLASPVGVNTSIIDNGVNGYLCQTNQDWMIHLELLLNDTTHRIRLGQSGRKKVVEQFSLLSNQRNFLSLFE